MPIIKQYLTTKKLSKGGIMERIIGINEKEITLSELKDVTELIFEDKKNWFITYSVQMLDYCMEYCQSTGRGEICGVEVNTLEHGEKALKFTDNGKHNIQIVKSHVSEQPSLSRKTIAYHKLIKKD